MPRTADRVKETTTGTGTGNLALSGAVSQFRGFAAVFGYEVQFQYAIVGQTGTEWEVGFGHIRISDDNLARDKVMSSSNSGALVNLSAGTKDVFATALACCVEDASLGKQVAQSSGWAMP